MSDNAKIDSAFYCVIFTINKTSLSDKHGPPDFE